MELVTTQVRRRQWRLIRHVLGMEQGAIPCTALTWAPEGKRKRGQPKEIWRCTVERELQEMGIRSRAEAFTIVRDREVWRERRFPTQFRTQGNGTDDDAVSGVHVLVGTSLSGGWL